MVPVCPILKPSSDAFGKHYSSVTALVTTQRTHCVQAGVWDFFQLGGCPGALTQVSQIVY